MESIDSQSHPPKNGMALNNPIKEKDTLNTAKLSAEEAIYRILANYLNKRSPYITPAAIENNDISRATIHVILNAQGKHKLKSRTLIGLMKGLHRGKTLREISLLYEGELGDRLKKLVADYVEHPDAEYADPFLEELLENHKTYKIVLLALSKNGTTKNELIQEMGNQCLGTLERLLNKTILIKKNNRIYYKKRGHRDVSLSIPTTQKLSLNLLQNCYWQNDEDMGPEELTSAMYVRVKEVNLEWYLPRALERIKKCVMDLEEMGNHPNAAGDSACWHTMALAPLNSKDSKRESQRENENDDRQTPTEIH